MRRWSRHLALALVGALVLSGCVIPDGAGPPPPTSGPRADGGGNGGASPVAPHPSPTTDAHATPRGTPGPPTVGGPCGAARVTQIVGDFLAAFNRGDQAALAQFFPEQGFDPADPRNFNRLEVYSLDAADPNAGIDHLNLYTRTTLLAYFAERQRQHERIRLLDLRALDQGLTAGFGFTLSRQADGLRQNSDVGW